jgi:hypothetical protein
MKTAWGIWLVNLAIAAGFALLIWRSRRGP